jgi:hypothetical protein
MPREYRIRRAAAAPTWLDTWDSALWNTADTAAVSDFHPRSSSHRPETRVRLLYDRSNLYGRFQVRDSYLLCRHLHYQDPVYRDACVEFFVQPRADKGYFNFEMNCCGALLLRYVEDPTRGPAGELARSTPVPPDIASEIEIRTSLNGPIEPELLEVTDWSVFFVIPLGVLEHYTGPLGDPAGQVWRGNFYKCAEDNSHPHWASWSPIGSILNFHQPEAFGILRFE